MNPEGIKAPLSQLLLEELQKLAPPNRDIILLCTTNDPSQLDPALKERPASLLRHSLLFAGEPGTGKAFLLEQLRRQADASEPVMLRLEGADRAIRLTPPESLRGCPPGVAAEPSRSECLVDYCQVDFGRHLVILNKNNSLLSPHRAHQAINGIDNGFFVVDDRARDFLRRSAEAATGSVFAVLQVTSGDDNRDVQRLAMVLRSQLPKDVDLVVQTNPGNTYSPFLVSRNGELVNLQS